MKFRSAALCLGLAVAGFSAWAGAAPVPVTVNVSSVLDIQSYNVGENATDQAYLIVTGVAAGKPVDARLPKEKTWSTNAKQPAVEPKTPAELWKGDLDDGQFAALTVTLFQGKGEDAAPVKKLMEQLAAAESKVAGLSAKTLTADAAKTLAAEKLKADQSVIKKVKDLFSREKNTDHFGGQFTLLVWNEGGKLSKRLDPVGLTFGEHYGNDIKIYSKLKNTRNNVLAKNEKGQWEEQQLEPVSDDQTAVRVKELEVEYIKQAAGNPIPHTTDYVVEVQVIGGDGKPLTWTAEGENKGVDAIHTYWMFAD